LLFILVLAVPRGFAQSGTFPVREVVVEGLYSISEEELLYILGIEPGMELDAGDVRAGIERAFMKGIFDDIKVERVRENEGLIRIQVMERDFISDVRVKGNERISGKFIKNSLDLKEDEVMRYDLIEESRDMLLDLMGQRGFPSARVDLSVLRTKTPHRVDLIVEIEEGEPLIVDRIKVEGRATLEIVRLMDMKTGDTFDKIRLKKDLEKLERHYRDMGYLDPIVGPYTFRDGLLHLSVETGLRLRMDVEGSGSISKKKILEEMPFFEAREFRDDLVEEAVRRIQEIYFEEGFFSVQVAPVLEEKEGGMALTFFIFEGQKVLVESIRINSEAIPESKVKEIMALKRNDAFNPHILESDLQNIKEFYIALGYVNVSVKEPIVEITEQPVLETTDQPIVDTMAQPEQYARIRIDVEEGEKVLISGISFKGVKSLGEGLLREGLTIRLGDPYNEVDISDARRNVLAAYRSLGYYECTVDVTRDFAPEGARLVFDVEEGNRLYFGRTVVKGNMDTRHRVILREIQYKEGMPLDSELLTRTRLRLYRLNLFSSVEVSTLERKDSTVDIVFDVREGRAGTVEFGVGYGEYERYRAFFDISYKNLFGLNRQVSLRTEVDSLSNRIILNYYEPWFFGKAVESRTLLMREDRKEKNIDTGDINYRVRKYTLSTGIEKGYGKRVKLTLYYEFSLVDTFDVKPDVVLSREDTGTLSIISLSPGIIYDSRDDPFDPQRGVFAGMTVKPASKLIMSETDFVKAVIHASKYQRVKKWLVLALSLRGGAAEGFRDTVELPLVERFFLGGRNTVRGYNQDSLGPKGKDGTPQGGNAYVLGNLELRTRVFGKLRLVPFIDAGNVWTTVDDVRLGDVKYTAGAGIQYNTPAGPFRLDYGCKLKREAGESGCELHFSLGHAF
jgi:outer membrane protein insertion porin family